MKRVFNLIAVLVVIMMVLSACQTPAAPTQPTQPQAPAASPQPQAPAAPKFDSMGSAPDEGTVKPVDKQPSKPLRIAVLGLENNPFWIPVKQGTQAAADALKAYNTTVEWIVPGDQHTADVFGKAVEAAITKQYDAIATIAGDAGMVPYINKAVDAGIPVATFNSETAQQNKRLFFVGADLYLQGQTAGENMCKVLGNKGKVAIITGFFAVEAHELRRKGFEDALAKNCPDVKIVGRVENNDKGDVAYTQANDFMTANPDLSAIYVTAGGPFGAAKAIEEAGRTGQVHMISFDFVDETMQFVQKGVIDGTIGQDPFAQGHDPAIRLFNYIVAGQVPQYARLVTKADFVTKANIDQFWKPSTPAQPTAPAGQAPTFDSMCTPDDEGTVKPVDKQPSKPLRIAVLGLENNPFWIPVKQGTQAAADALKAYNTTVEWIVPGDQHTADVFGKAVEAAITKQYDAIATIAGDAGMVPYINKAVDAGIPVATFNSETAQQNKRLFFVGADLYLQGQTAGENMCKVLGNKGKVAIITGFFAVEAHELRRKGFEDALAKNCPDVKIVGRVENNDKGDVAYTQAKDFMTANPNLSGIYVTAGGPFGAAKAVEEAGKTGTIHMVSFDFVDETMQFVQKGVIDATIGQDPFAQGHDPAIRLYNWIVAQQAPTCGRLVTRADVVTKDNISQFWTPPK